MIAELAIRNVHKEEGRNKLCARSCLKDLKARTKCVSSRMACTGDHTVSIAHLDHHDAIVCVGFEKKFCCLLDSHALLLAKLDQLVNVSRSLVTLSRIYDDSACDICILLICGDFFFRTDNDDLGESFFQDLLSGLVCADIF